ncbi:MAG: response regulator [Pseudomonadota bacterium]
MSSNSSSPGPVSGPGNGPVTGPVSGPVTGQVTGVADSTGVGSEIMAERYGVTVQRGHWSFINDVLIVEDDDVFGNRLPGTLRVLMRREIEVRRADTLNSAVDEVLRKMPDVVFLDDYLKPSDSAVDTIPYLRRAGYKGHIIVISGEIDRRRSRQLIGLGATTTLHKDDANSTTLGEALLKIGPETADTPNPVNVDVV